jgi:hypothetical protein
MNRRRLLAALGGLAGTGSAIGTGAFTSVSADRDLEVQVADDADALLALSPCDGPNGDYVTTSGGTAAIDVTASNGNIDGSGVNAEATTVADGVLSIRNQGTQPVGVWLDVDPVEDGSGTDRLQFYVDGDRSTEIVGQANAVCLGVGESVCVGFSADTHGVSSTSALVTDDAMVVNADAGVGCSTGSVPGVDGGPLAHYPFDGDAVDATGNGYDGSVQGGSFIGSARLGSDALALDGEDDYVEVGGIPDGQLTEGLTVAAWIRPDALTPPGSDYGMRIVADDSNGSPGSGYALSLGDGGSGRLRFYNRGKDTISLDTGAVVSPGQWHHVAAVYDGSTPSRQIYVDGTQEAALAADTGTWQTDPGPLTIGGESDASPEQEQYFDGRIDDVRVYDRALSASEVAALASPL